MLSTTFTSAYDVPTGETLPPSWCVINEDEIFRGELAVVVSGFARDIDAKAAARALQNIGIDWTAPSEEIDRQWEAFGGRKEIEKVACSALQW